MTRQDFVTVRGDTFSIKLELVDVDPSVTVESVYFTVKSYPESKAFIFQKSLGHGIEPTDDNGVIITVAPEDTHDVPAGEYVYDLQLGLGSSIYTIIMGNYTIIQDVTEN